MQTKLNCMKVKNYLRRGSPTILTCLGAVGMVTTTILAVRSTPKALKKIRSDSKVKHGGDSEAYSKCEAIESAWTYYIPTTIIGISTLICIFGANALNKQQQAMITSAYAMLNNVYSEYKQKLIDIYGEEAHHKIIDSIAAEKVRDVYISSTGIISSNSLDFGDNDPNDVKLFYDVYSARYFESTISKVLQAEYHLNRNYVLAGCLPVNDFYEFLGLEPLESGNELGWSWDDGLYWIDFNHRKTVLDDGLEVYVIEMEWMPDVNWNEE